VHALVVFAALALALPAGAARDVVIANARLVDGTGAPPRGGVSIRIRDERIVEIGTAVAAPPVRARSTRPG
jgi:hypothetical protein